MKIKKLNEDIQHCWFGYYVDHNGEKKYFYMTKDVAGKDPDYAAEYMEDSIPEPFTKYVFCGSIANTQAEKQGMKLVESKSISETYWIDNKEVMDEVDRLNRELQADGWMYRDDKYTGSNYYVIFQRRGDNGAEFCAVKYSHTHTPEVVELSYRQIVGDEPMDSFDGMRRRLGKALLPKRESKSIKTLGSKAKKLNESDTVTRFKMEYYIDDGDRLTDYIYADSKEDAEKQLKDKVGKCKITAAIPETVPADYKKWDMNESADYKVKFFQVFEAPKSPTDNGKMIGQRGTLEDANAFGKERVGEGNYIIKAVCDDGQTRNIDNDTDASVYTLAEAVTGKYGKVTYEKRADGLDGDTAHYAGYHLFSNDGKYTPYWAGETAMGSSYSNIEDAVAGIDSYIDKQKASGKMKFIKAVNESIEVATIADYITDHYEFDDIDDKYGCINSIRDSFKDEKTISYEVLNQFIGAHNGRDKLEESNDVQYGVHQFSTDSIIFRGTEEECGKYIDNNKKLWDDAEVYRMEPGDPHYKKIEEASKGFQKEFYNGYVILKNRAGDGWDVYSYDGTPEKVTKAYLEDEGFATLQAAKDAIDEWNLVSGTVPDTTADLVGIRKRPYKESVNEASYGGAFDIEDDQYFTRDDLNSFAEEVLSHVSETFDGSYDIGGVWFEDGNVITQIVDADGSEFEDTTHVDMRKIREPWHLKRAYALTVASSIIAQIKEYMNESLTENVKGMGEYSDKFYDYLDYLEDNGDEGSLSYLVSQLIRYCKEEDLRDLWIDRMGKVAQDNGFGVESSDDDIDESKKLKEGLEDEVATAQRYLDVEIPEICGDMIEIIPNMPEHRLVFVNQKLRKFHSIMEYYTNMYSSKNESLTEDVETPVLSAPAEGPESGLASLLNTAMQDELKTIQMYNDMSVTAKAEGFEEIAAQIDEINTEENKHVGQIQELLKTIAPNAQAIDAGELEAGDALVTVEENINNSTETPNNNSEDIKEAVIMEGTERWEQIYQSFKNVEKELNGDGEAVTAVIDRMYQDNKDDPDYKRAYDKWASNE